MRKSCWPLSWGRIFLWLHLTSVSIFDPSFLTILNPLWTPSTKTAILECVAGQWEVQLYFQPEFSLHILGTHFQWKLEVSSLQNSVHKKTWKKKNLIYREYKHIKVDPRALFFLTIMNLSWPLSVRGLSLWGSVHHNFCGAKLPSPFPTQHSKYNVG